MYTIDCVLGEIESTIYNEPNKNYLIEDLYEIINRTQTEGIIKDPRCLSVTKEDIIESYGGERLWSPESVEELIYLLKRDEI